MPQPGEKFFTIAISTRTLERFCLKAIDSLLKSKNVPAFEFIIVADECRDFGLIDEIEKRGIKLIVNHKSLSLSAKFKQLVKMCQTEIFIITQDDLTFDSLAISHVLETFSVNKNATMVVSRVCPRTPLNFFQSILNVGVRIVYEIGKKWNRGDNYLLVNGRLMAFKTEFLHKFTIPDSVINFDAFLYFENKRHKGQFIFCDKSLVYNALPTIFSEHLGQSSRFLFSRRELEMYFGSDLSEAYSVPKHIVASGLIKMFLVSTFKLILYLVVVFLTRIFRKKDTRVINPLWKPDLSTK